MNLKCYKSVILFLVIRNFLLIALTIIARVMLNFLLETLVIANS
jgi:hypothetical protein